jgi:predicted RNA polymerase sigma factor
MVPRLALQGVYRTEKRRVLATLIRDERLPYEVPGRAELPERLESVLRVIYLIFNEATRPRRGPACCGPTFAQRRCGSGGWQWACWATRRRRGCSR